MNTNDILLLEEGSINYLLNFLPCPELLLLLYSTRLSPRIWAISAQVFRASLFSHPLSDNRINKSMVSSLSGLWSPPVSYFYSCQSKRTLICLNTLMHWMTPWMFIKLFSNERWGSISDCCDSCICADLLSGLEHGNISLLAVLIAPWKHSFGRFSN